MQSYEMDPKAIERMSFEIITEELGAKTFEPPMDKVIKRVIHTTADFEYADILEFHPDSVRLGIRALASGCKVYADTQMIIAGVNKKALERNGVSMVNYVHEPEVYALAAETGVTRSMVALEKASAESEIKIYAVGNAPTALFKLKSLIEAGTLHPDLIIGVPVGFVGAAESKAAIKATCEAHQIPYIITNGRKGGSPIAATILNAMLYMI